MDFSESPKLFISQYYDDQRNKIDFNCEKLFLDTEEKTKKEIPQDLRKELNDLRQNMV